MDYSLIDSFVKSSEFAAIPVLLVILVKWSQLSKPQRFYGVVIIAIFLNQIMAAAIGRLDSGNNLPLYHLYLVIESTGLLMLFRFRFSGNRKKWLIGIAIGLVMVTVLNAIVGQGLHQIPTYTRSIEAIIMAALSLYYFRHVFVEGQVKRLDKSFWFWISAGLLLYFTSNLLLFIFTNSLTNREDQLFLGVWAIHAGLNFLLYGFYAVAFLCQDRESSYSS